MNSRDDPSHPTISERREQCTAKHPLPSYYNVRCAKSLSEVTHFVLSKPLLGT